MKKIFLLLTSFIFLVTGEAQSGEKNLQARAVKGFHGVEVSGGIDLYLSSGTESVAVTASNTEVRDHMITEVEDGMLKIHLENNWNYGGSTSHMKAYVSIKELRTLEGSGGGDIYLQNEMSGGDIRIRLSGGSDLKGKLNANHLVINQSGGSDVDLTGIIKKLEVDASGGSDLKGFGLITDFASLRSSGGCESHLTVNKELDIIASGGSEVLYKGAATVNEIKSSGSSSVTRKD